jgi:hypothetical protein
MKSEHRDWPREAARAVAHDVGAFLQTARAVLVEPTRFAAEWTASARSGLNPLAFVLNAGAVIGPWRVLWARLLDPNAPSVSLGWQVAHAVMPLLLSFVTVTMCHALLKLLGTRAPLRSTAAVALFVTGGPIALGNLPLVPVMIYVHAHPSDDARLALAPIVLPILVAMMVYEMKMLRAVHGLPRGRIMLAVVVTFLAVVGGFTWLNVAHAGAMQTLLRGG